MILDPYRGTSDDDSPEDQIAFGRYLQKVDAENGRSPDPKLADLIAQAQARLDAEQALGE